MRSPTISILSLLLAGALGATGIIMPVPAFADSARTAGPLDTKRLEGRWTRLDGSYVLHLRGFGPDGSVKAAYFNPRPINVGRGELRHREGYLTITVELRDVNYPGSTYTLRYEPKSDRLVGTYFQAVERQTYDVEFIRSP